MVKLLGKHLRKWDRLKTATGVVSDEDLMINYTVFRNTCSKVREKIFEKVEQGKMTVAEHMNDSIDEVIEHGLHNVGMYHAKRPLIKTSEGDITTMDMNLLYFYRNRLDGYGLEKYV